jgi:translation elongation factor EF-4
MKKDNEKEFVGATIKYNANKAYLEGFRKAVTIHMSSLFAIENHVFNDLSIKVTDLQDVNHLDPEK